MAFYSIMLVENALLVGLWYPHRDPHMETVNVVMLSTVILGFVLGECCAVSAVRAKLQTELRSDQQVP